LKSYKEKYGDIPEIEETPVKGWSMLC